MNARTKPGLPLRSVTLSRDALSKNLAELYAKNGAEMVLDLRGDALGCGAITVGELARDVGIRYCSLSPGDSVPSGLTLAREDAPRVTGWWDGAGGPVMSFCARVVSLKRVPEGTTVSYGYEYTTQRSTTLALVSAGFADGVPRSASGKALVGLGSDSYPVAGRIAMDQCVVDVGDATLEVGALATLWGEAPTLHQWALWSARPEASLLSHIGARVVKTWR
jgi:alanine racemase